MKIYHLKTCDTCRKAIKEITAAGHDPQLIDVRADGVAPADLAKLIDAAGWETLLNTRSTTWRGLEASDKEDLDAGRAATLMTAHPTLIKRPVITDGDTVTVGWKAEQKAVWA